MKTISYRAKVENVEAIGGMRFAGENLRDRLNAPWPKAVIPEGRFGFQKPIIEGGYQVGNTYWFEEGAHINVYFDKRAVPVVIEGDIGQHEDAMKFLQDRFGINLTERVALN